jgi:iron complex outermembrane recepter protein
MNTPVRAGRRAAPPLAFSLLSFAIALTARAQTHESPEEIVVTGVLRDSSPVDLAQAVSVVSGDELDRLRGANLGEALSNQLGVSSSYFGAGASRPIIRGLAGARVQMLEDGINSMDAATVSDDHAVTIEPLAADQIEIFRGPTTLLYGSGAIGGVVNTVTTRIPSRAPENGLEGAFEVRGDSVADSRGAAVRLDGGASNFAWHVDAGTRDSDDYEIPGFAQADADLADPDPEDVFGIVENSAAESDSLALGASWLGDKGFIGIGVSMLDSLYGIPGHHHEHEEEAGVPPPAEEEEEVVRIDLEQQRVDLRGGWQDLQGAIEGVNVRVGMNDYEHVELEGDEIGTQFTNEGTELRVELLHRAAGQWNGAFGVQVGERKFAAVGAEAFVPPVDTSTLGIFIVEKVDLEKWQLELGGRLDSLEHTPTDGLPVFDDNGTSLSLGAVRSFGDGYAFVASFSLSDRIPVAEELYSDGPHLATGAVQIGEPSLDNETAQHVDIGVRGTAGGVSWSVTGFNTRYDQFIYLADTGTVDPVDDLPIFVFTQADADFQGIEAELFVPLMEDGPSAVDMRLFVDYVHGELTTGEKLPRLPPLRYGGRFEYHNERLLVGVEATRYNDQDDIAPFETATDGYMLLNADLRWRLGSTSGTEFELFANATNLGDEDARKHTSFVKDIAPLPGRNYALGIRSRF